jgi:hypothetical protein
LHNVVYSRNVYSGCIWDHHYRFIIKSRITTTLYVYPTQWKIWTLIIIMHQYMTNRFTGFQIKCKLCIGNDWQLNIILLRYFFEFEPVHSEVYSIQHYMIKFVNGFGQVGGFIWQLLLLPPIKLKYCWKWR